MSEFPARIALFYDDEGYREKAPGTSGKSGRPEGPVGRQVAGAEFLDALVTHGRWAELTAVAPHEAGSAALLNHWVRHPKARTDGRALRVVPLGQFHRHFFPEAPAPVLHFPGPINPAYAWARQHGGASYCLSGVTHTICTWRVIDWFNQMITAPFESFDALICISRQARETIRTITGAYADHLRERFGGAPQLRPRLEHIPLGVNPDKYHPACPEERAEVRARLAARDDEVVVLFVGRLSYHTKVHPFPIYAGLDRAACETGVPVHLVMAGWATSDVTLEAFRSGARTFAPNVRTTFVDGTKPEWRHSVWHAADVFTSLTDNVQETLSQVILEGMACGLPVVATDWDGCKDQVVEGETGFRVPTYAVHEATRDLTSRLVLGEVNYDRFLAEANQAVAVDVPAASAAFARLLTDPALRRQMGEAGRRRVLEQFTWARVVRAYEELWAALDAERRAFRVAGATRRPHPGPACYPALDHSFAAYPGTILKGETLLQATDDSSARLEQFLAHPLTNYAADARCPVAPLSAVLNGTRQPVRVAELDALFAERGVETAKARATLAWMLKYDLLRVCSDLASNG